MIQQEIKEVISDVFPKALINKSVIEHSSRIIEHQWMITPDCSNRIIVSSMQDVVNITSQRLNYDSIDSKQIFAKVLKAEGYRKEDLSLIATAIKNHESFRAI